ncbi:MAG: hypothetical protein ACRC10_02370 [Thermoguttaceae bacterium]
MKQEGIVGGLGRMVGSFLSGLFLFAFVGCASPYQVATERAMLMQENRQLEDALYVTHERLQNSLRTNDQLRTRIVEEGKGSGSGAANRGLDEGEKAGIPKSALPGSISTEGLQPSGNPPTFWENSPTSPIAPPPARPQPALPKGVRQQQNRPNQLNRPYQQPSLLTSLFQQNQNRRPNPSMQRPSSVAHSKSAPTSTPTPSMPNRSPMMPVQSPQSSGYAQDFPDLSAELNEGEFIVPDSVQFPGSVAGEYPSWSPRR